MSKLQEQVKQFHRAYGHPIGEVPHVPNAARVRLRLMLIAEEFGELMAAAFSEDAIDVAETMKSFPEMFDDLPICVNLPAFVDALADLDYVIEGTRVEFGIDGDPIAEEVHRSNTSKLGADGKPILRVDGKVLKGPNYTPPDIVGELRKQGWVPR